jgi:hypothetical protein
MRREDKAIVELAEIEQILHKALVCRLGLTDGIRPYVVPLSFGFKNNTLYFHSAPEGKKIEMLRKCYRDWQSLDCRGHPREKRGFECDPGTLFRWNP